LARGNAERMAINTPIQGTAADMIKLAMVKLQAALKSGGFQSKMILQVHDELVFDVRRDELEPLKPLIEQHMREALPGLKVPIVVEIGVGENWLEAH
ncbi:MAG: DNA polymerase I, partial [Bacteroidetes bacterium]